MWSLIKNEIGKIFLKKSSWIYMIILFAIVLAGAFIDNIFYEKPTENWREELESEIVQLEKELQSAEEYDQEWLIYQIEQKQNYLEENIQPNAYSNWHFMNGMVYGMMSLVTLFAAIVASASVSAEFGSGTIKQLLIRPHHRWKVLLSKYLASIIYSLILLAVLIILGLTVGTIFFGAGDFNAKFFEMTFGEDKVAVVGKQFFLKVLYYLPSLLIVITIAFMLSTLFKSQALAVGISIFVLFISSTVGGLIIMLAEKYAWAKYLIFPHMDLTIYTMQDTILNDVTLTDSLLILAVYYVIFIILTFTIFQKRDITV